MFLADRLGMFLQGEEATRRPAGAADRVDDAVRKLSEVPGPVGKGRPTRSGVLAGQVASLPAANAGPDGDPEPCSTRCSARRPRGQRRRPPPTRRSSASPVSGPNSRASWFHVRTSPQRAGNSFDEIAENEMYSPKMAQHGRMGPDWVGEVVTDRNTGVEGPLSDLLGLVIPGQHSAGQSVDWAAAEGVVGHRFPTDYRELIEHIGGGSLEASLEIRLPVVTLEDTDNRICGLSAEALVDPLSNRWRDPESAASYRIEDMLIWGESSGADTLCWITSSDEPDKWPIAVYNRNDLAWVVYDCTVTEFILGILRAEFTECPLSDETLFGMGSVRFLSIEEENELMGQGIDPWA
ncbi:SMI1/KNR4 family protein [Streptomyces sp. NPDC004267]|uniref:SMI1/KNR4 family protein n=1 Tax=Streptomyces sp. NPDC004267 TaxID=3364694 RepID=UPI003681BAF1